jgi:hypothetical protein
LAQYQFRFPCQSVSKKKKSQKRIEKQIDASWFNEKFQLRNSRTYLDFNQHFRVILNVEFR